MIQMLLYYLVGTAWVSYAMAKSGKEEKSKKAVTKDFLKNYLSWILLGGIGLAGSFFIGGTFNFIGEQLVGSRWFWPVAALFVICGWAFILGLLAWFTKNKK